MVIIRLQTQVLGSSDEENWLLEGRNLKAALGARYRLERRVKTACIALNIKSLIKYLNLRNEAFISFLVTLTKLKDTDKGFNSW